MRRYLLFGLTLAVSLLAGSSGAQAVVVDMNAIGQTSVSYNSSDQSGYVGVALVPGSCSDLTNTHLCNALATRSVPTVTSSGPCLDPALTSDLWLFGQTDRLPDNGLCYHGGSVVHKNEAFALTWDAPLPSGSQHNYWSGTRNYVEQFMRDVADGSGTLTSPYAVTTQYTDSTGRAGNASLYGGGCIDYGASGGSACEFGTTGVGHAFPASGCTPKGDSFTYVHTVTANTVCLTDAQLQGEIAAMITQTGILGRTQPGYTPTLVLLTPPGVETCLDTPGKMCSANGNLTPPQPTVTAASTGGTVVAGTYQVEVTYATAGGESLPSVPETVTTTGSTSTITIDSPPATNGATGWYAYVTQPGETTFERQGSQTAIGSSFTLSAPPAAGGAAPPLVPLFCSYHSRVNVGGTEIAYAVQPWTAMTACDEPDAPPLGANPTPQQLSTNVGIRLVSPLSQAQIGALVNPGLNGWMALDGSEINDNGRCVPLAQGLDSVTVGGSSQNPYLLQREFNNAGVIESDPNTYFGCAPNVLLSPNFVVPSPINANEVVEFDGSISPSTLIVPSAGYAWEFGDGTSAVGPSVEHVYAKGGTWSVKLTLTDRGGNVVQSEIKEISVIGPPANTTVPTISDLTSLSPANVVSGDKLEVSTGSWSGYPTPVYAYQWQDCNAVGESCTAINGATAATYTPVAADVGHTLRVELTASNAVGSGKATSAQTAVVNAGSGQLSTSPLAPGGSITSTGTAGISAGLKVKLQLVPESLKSLLRNGVAVTATVNEAADGVTSISITPSEAKRAHILYRPSQSAVVIGRGTVKGLVNGADHLHLRLSKQIAAKLKRLRRVVLTIQVKVVDSRGESQTVSATGRY
jgi:PKD domain